MKIKVKITDIEIPVIVHDDPDGFWAEFPTMPGCATCGDTREELMRNIHEAVDCHLGDSNVDDNGKIKTANTESDL